MLTRKDLENIRDLLDILWWSSPGSKKLDDKIIAHIALIDKALEEQGLE